MSNFISSIENKNTIITSAPGEGSTNLLYYICNELAINSKLILLFDTGNQLNREYLKKYYFGIYNFVFIFQGSYEDFMNYISNINRNLSIFDYIFIDTADILNKDKLYNLIKLLSNYNIKLICTSQLRINPNNSKPYSTVEEWNKQFNGLLFDCSIWIRKVNEPNKFLNRKYIDIYDKYRIGNKYQYRSILNFDRKQGFIT